MPRRGLVQVEVEENANTHALPMHVFPVVGLRRPVLQVVLIGVNGLPAPHRVTGWSSQGGGTPCPAYCVPVEDSGSSETVLSYLVFGGDWGLRFKPLSSPVNWSLTDPDQFGEPCLLMADDPVTEWLEAEARRLEQAP